MTQFTFNHDAEPVPTSDVYYDLFEGGYIHPEDLVQNPSQVDLLNEAINLIQEFLDQAENVGLIEHV